MYDGRVCVARLKKKNETKKIEKVKHFSILPHQAAAGNPVIITVPSIG